MRRLDSSPCSRVPTGNTPLRGRGNQMASPHAAHTTRNHKELALDTRTLSPNKLTATKKPLISPKLNHNYRSRRHECVTHIDREAEYKILINGQLRGYCQKCAAQLASKGFLVERIYTSKTKSTRKLFSSNPIYEGNPRAMQIGEFMDTLREVDSCMRENSRNLVDIESHYKNQIRQLEQFYNQIVCYVNCIRKEQVDTLREECREFTQIAKKELRQNEMNLDEISQIAYDIESQMENIVTAITEDQFKATLNLYNKNIEEFRQRLQQQGRTMGEVTNLKVQDLQTKLQQCKHSLCELLGVQEQVVTSNQFSFEGSKQNQPDYGFRRFGGKENKGPFRNLFAEQTAFAPPDESPHFKIL